MDWNSNLKATAPFVSSRPETSFSFLYNYNYEQFPADIMKQAAMMPAFTESGSSMGIANNNNGHDPKKKRLSNEQLEMLENSFQDEVKLDPDRKMKLAKELGLHPRQIAVWFQNRRARWKSKQLERLYDALKQEYDAVSRDKLKLQQEVMALRSILNKEQTVGKNQISTGYTEISVESTSIPSTSDQNPRHRQYDPTATNDPQQIADQCNATANNNYGIFHVDCDDYNNGGNNNNNNTVLMMPPYWGPPSCP